MNIKDNVLKEALKNVYFISGTACGGKSTISRELGNKYNIPVYDIDQVFSHHQAISNMSDQPAMNQSFANADEFFGRSFDEYRDWILNNTREQLDFVITDLIRISQNQKVICDCHILVEEARRLTDEAHIAFLLREPKNVLDDYCNRPDHTDFKDFIESATDVPKAKALCNQVLESINTERCKEIKESEFFYLERDDSRSIQETMRIIENHFGWNEKKDFMEQKGINRKEIVIKKVEKGTQLADDLLNFVCNCSWIEIREHIAYMIREWVFTDWEAMFVALMDGKIIGMTSIMKTDYYPIPEIYPWVSCVFVSEEYRGYKISGMLIDFANEYAKENGFDKTYIPTEFFGLYEHYGYQYVKDIINYGGDRDHLFVKEFKD